MRRRRSGIRNQFGGGSLAETGPVLLIFFLFFVLPFLDLISFGMGVATVMFVSNWGVRQAAPCQTFTEAKESIKKTETSLENFRKFAEMKPHDGGDSGVKIRVQVTKADGSGTKHLYEYENRSAIPNEPPTDPSNPILPDNNTANSIYQYVVTSSYDVSPLFNFAKSPFLNQIPALGKPVPVEFSSVATVEHPEGLREQQ